MTILLHGEAFYTAVNGVLRQIRAQDARGALLSAWRTLGVEGFARGVEGSYLGLWIDRKRGRGGLFGDLLNRRPLYYCETARGFEGSTSLADVVPLASGGFDPHALYAYFVLGYPPHDETFYTGVRRLGADELIEFSSHGVSRRSVAVEVDIEVFGPEHLDRYDALLANAVAARASTAGNVVMNSGGWDSTALIYQLTEATAPRDVRSVVFDVLLPDGQSFNVYEVDKAKRIAKFYGIRAERAEIDYGRPDLVDYWVSKAALLREHHVYFWIHHLMMADQVGRRAAPGIGVFNGEASDSIHNFGYSQFVSVNYDNMLLREYADKAKSYLYGPTFFNRLADGSFADDRVLRFFHGYYGPERFEIPKGAADRRAAYFEAFMLSYPRVPFATWQPSGVAGAALRTTFADHVRRAYFGDVSARATPRTLYYWLLQLYRRFHFHSFQIEVNQAALAPYGLECRMPFLDGQLVDFMYRMPENWGRGLELRTTKYPLRYLAAARWRMPLHILEEEGPHSYIAEADRRWSYAGGSWNIYCEIMFRSVFRDYFRELLQRADLEAVFDPSLFDVQAMRGTVQRYVGGQENPADVTLLFRLGVLLSVGFLKGR